MIKTNRLKIYAASQDQMENFIAVQTVDVLKEAYREMLDGCLAHPDQWNWYAIWMIELQDGTHVGELCFMGLSEDGVAEIGYGIVDDYQGRGYATEAVSAICRWALEQPDVKSIVAETEETNIASQNVLKKAGFVQTGEIGEEGPISVRIGEWLGEEAGTFQSPTSWKEKIGASDRIESVETWEMECFDVAWNEWLAIENEFAAQDKKYFDTHIKPYSCIVGICIKTK